MVRKGLLIGGGSLVAAGVIGGTIAAGLVGDGSPTRIVQHTAGAAPVATTAPAPTTTTTVVPVPATIDTSGLTPDQAAASAQTSAQSAANSANSAATSAQRAQAAVVTTTTTAPSATVPNVVGDTFGQAMTTFAQEGWGWIADPSCSFSAGGVAVTRELPPSGTVEPSTATTRVTLSCD